MLQTQPEMIEAKKSNHFQIHLNWRTSKVPDVECTEQKSPKDVSVVSPRKNVKPKSQDKIKDSRNIWTWDMYTIGVASWKKLWLFQFETDDE